MNYKIYILLLSGVCVGCQQKNTVVPEKQVTQPIIVSIPKKNKEIVNAVEKWGPTISSTYEKAVCTELVIAILQKFVDINPTDKQRIRIITKQNIQNLIKNNSPIPQGVHYALIAKGVGTSIEKEDVLSGDFVQFWTETWGHCGIVKSIDVENNQMELYSSFPSTNGYGIQKFSIPSYCYFVRLK